jgi:hypothetical protein
VVFVSCLARIRLVPIYNVVPTFFRRAAEDVAVKRRLLFVVVLLSGAALVAVVGISGFLPKPGSNLPEAPRLLESDLDAESQELENTPDQPRQRGPEHS